MNAEKARLAYEKAERDAAFVKKGGYPRSFIEKLDRIAAAAYAAYQEAQRPKFQRIRVVCNNRAISDTLA